MAAGGDGRAVEGERSAAAGRGQRPPGALEAPAAAAEEGAAFAPPTAGPGTRFPFLGNPRGGAV